MFALAVLLASCAKFGGEDGEQVSPDGGAVPDGGETDGGADGGAAQVVVRCGGISCHAPEKCCLPFYDGKAGCVRAEEVCGADVAELLCSDPSACSAGQVCCLNAVRNAGQTGFLIATTYCGPASACPDGPLQHRACRLGAPPDQCPSGTTCKPYLRDTNGAQSLDLDHTGYATCQ